MPGAPSGVPLDRALQRYQRSHPKMGRNDRLVLGTAVYQFARNRTLLLEAGRGFTAGEGDLLLLGLLDAVSDQADLGQIRHLPDGVRPWRRHLAWLQRERDHMGSVIETAGPTPLGDVSPGIVATLSRLHSVPEWWISDGPWETVGDAAAELAVLRRPQQLTLRVQSHQCSDRTQVIEGLKELGIPCRPTPRSPWGITVEGRHNVLATEIYRDGSVEVQDEGSQLVTCLMDPKPTEKILDACAGGGGKSLALASAMGGRGQVIAYDTHTGRLRDARKRARRAGLGNIRVVEDFQAVQNEGDFDQVLVDVPCTSSGTLRRNPDVAWRWDRDALTKLLSVQRDILDRVASLVRPGGYLTYATCSLLPQENGEQISMFLERHHGFRALALGDRDGHTPLHGVPGFEQGVLRLPAHLGGYSGDGFFMARFRNEG